MLEFKVFNFNRCTGGLEKTEVRFSHIGIVNHRTDCSEKTTEQVRVTPKGLARLSEMLSLEFV